jgi:hypothetical protein
MLRGAVAAKLIWSWQQPAGWHVVTNALEVVPLADGQPIEDYVRGLYALGIQPLFRRSEPLDI